MRSSTGWWEETAWICSSADDASRGDVDARDRPSDATLDGVPLGRVAEATTRQFRPG